jgi:hypothetical protein
VGKEEVSAGIYPDIDRRELTALTIAAEEVFPEDRAASQVATSPNLIGNKEITW